MEDLAIEGQQQNSHWLEQHVGASQNASQLKRQPTSDFINFCTKRNINARSKTLSSTKHNLAKLSYVKVPTFYAEDSKNDSTLKTSQLGVNCAYSPHKLQIGYYARNDLQITPNEDNQNEGSLVSNENDKGTGLYQESQNSQNMFTNRMNSNKPMYRSVSASVPRSRLGPQRILGVTRGVTANSDFHLAAIKDWRSGTPEYVRSFNTSSEPFLKFENIQDSRLAFHYYGQTRINLQDPAGLFMNIRNKEQDDQQPKVIITQPKFHKLLNRRSINMAIVKNARKMSQGIGMGSRDQCDDGIGKPYDFNSWVPPIHYLPQKHVRNSKETLPETDIVSDSKSAESVSAVSVEEKCPNKPVVEGKSYYQQLSKGVLGHYAIMHQTETSQPVVQNSENSLNKPLSFSELFLLNVDNYSGSKKPNKRSVRFKVRDSVHEYEPWAPINS